MGEFFQKHGGALNLAKQQSVPNNGFRPGQLGAMHAVLAHKSVHDDPAIVWLPTGYGKTSLMMALPMLMGAKRVLVIEPSDALRKQVFAHFKELSTLRRIGAIDEQTPNPDVARLDGRPTDVAAWEALAQHDVVVSTASSATPLKALGAREDLFDVIIFDEAHHVPADTWSAFLDHYRKATFILLTATPFRRDGLPLPGKVVYRYPVTRAVAEGAFQPVAFLAAPEVANPLDDEAVDRAIAQTASDQLRADLAAGKDHRLLVRAESIKAARALVPIYEALGLKVEAIDSKVGKRTQDDAERRLQSGELQGIVCVDMFGEGYDFPKLKVAALHAPHRSLVPTIQFIGRFARSDATTGTATLIAPLSRIHDERVELLKEGVDLARMIDAAAQQQLSAGLAGQQVLDRLPVSRLTESDYESVSPLAFDLYAHVRVFRCAETPDFKKIGDVVAGGLRIVKQWLSADGTVSLALTADENPPSWATSDVLVNVRHDAFLLIYFQKSKHLYIGTTRRTEKVYQSLIGAVCSNFRLLSYEESSRARAGLEGVQFYNVGLRNTAFNSQSETYRMLTGPAAERAVTTGDGRAYVQGHFFGSGVTGSKKETIGASSSSKIWSNQTLSVREFLEWVEQLDGRLTGNAPFAQTQLDVVKATTTLKVLPDVVIAGAWPKAGFKANPRVRHREQNSAMYLYRSLTDFDLCDFVSTPASKHMDFRVAMAQFSTPFRFSIGGGQTISQLDPAVVIEVESANESWMPLADWLSEHPPVFYAADKSSFEGMNKMAAPQEQVAVLQDGDAEFIDWTGCAIGVEFVPSNGSAEAVKLRAKLAGAATVQEHLERYLLARPDLHALFYDHRSGEAADYIAVSVSADGDVLVTLYHCKGAGGAPSGGRVGDVYEVAGQLVKSVYYCDKATMLAHMDDRMKPRHQYPSKFVHGDLATLSTLLQATPATRLSFAVAGVQPGISRKAVDAHLADLMVFGVDYAKRGGAARAYWLVSE